MAAAVKRSCKGLVFVCLHIASDGIPFDTGGVNVGSERDGTVLVAFALVNCLCKCNQLPKGADGDAFALELGNGLFFDLGADRAGVGHFALCVLGRGLCHNAAVPIMLRRFYASAFRAAAAVSAVAVRCPCAEAMLVYGLFRTANGADAVGVVDVLMRCAALVIIHTLAEEHAVAVDAEHGVHIRSDLLTEGVAELIRNLAAREGNLREPRVVFHRLGFLAGEVVAVTKNVCVLIYAAERVCAS